MVDENEVPEVHIGELYDTLSFEYLIECAKNHRVDEWNQAYEAYLKAEWKRLFPNEEYDSENFGKLFNDDFNFVQPDFQYADFREAILNESKFSGFHLDGADFSNAHLNGVNFHMTHLNGTCFNQADLAGADFSNAHLEKARFYETHLEEADFRDAYLNETKFYMAHLEGVGFSHAHLEGVEFILCIVDGKTLFFINTIDNKTDFTGTSISSARLLPDLRTKLERNIRHLRWKDWYDKPKLYPIIAKTKSTLTVKLSLKKFTDNTKWDAKHCWVDRIINAFVRIFWWISNYGSSTKRIIAVFFGWNILWAVIYYYLLPFLPGISTTVLNVSDIWAAILQTNLMMFSITDLATEGLALFPMLCVTTHIVVGYFILAALITRLGIMFQNLSP